MAEKYPPKREPVRLTDAKIKSASCPPQSRESFVRDAVSPGLAVRVTSAGVKSYVFEGKLNRQTIRITIGDTRAWVLDAARAEARRIRTLIDQGRDPRIVKQESIAEDEAKRAKARRSEQPALIAWNEYLEIRRPEWSDSHYNDHLKVSTEGGVVRKRGTRPGESNLTMPGILRPLLSLPISRITASQVQSWLEKERAKRPTHTRLAFGLLRAFLNWAAGMPAYRGLVHPDACIASEVKRKIPAKNAKIDCLQREMLPLWFESVGKIANRTISVYLQCVLLTGARREEMAGLRWADCDFEWQSMTIRDKVEGERTIPMTPYIRSLLLDLRNRQAPKVRNLRGESAKKKASPYVFSSEASKTGRITEPRIAHNKALASVGLPSVSIHGLRRSFKTLSEWVEVPVGVVAQLMGHKPSATAERHYTVRPLDLLRKWHTQIEAWALTQAGISQPTISKTKAAANG